MIPGLRGMGGVLSAGEEVWRGSFDKPLHNRIEKRSTS
jgi:hypothetical protein